MQKAKVTMVVDLQFGSTGKGLIAGHWAKRNAPDMVVTSWSMNAGHTFIDADGTKYIHSMLANGIVSPALEYVMIGPGSQIGIECLHREIEQNIELLANAEIVIHANACVISDRHIAEEQGPMTAIGSTKKGCGAAAIEKIRRVPGAPITAMSMGAQILMPIRDMGIRARLVDTSEWLRLVYAARRILVEGAQGFSLGINSGFYPYTTSRECTPAQILSDCLIPVGMLERVIGTMRTYPIRVANRYNAQGEQVGWSGPGYSDQEETSFAALGLEEELTTVTKLPRRIFTFSVEQATQAIALAQPDEIFLNFVNYPGDHRKLMFDLTRMAQAVCGGVVRYVGVGPTENDVIDLTEPDFEQYCKKRWPEASTK